MSTVIAVLEEPGDSEPTLTALFSTVLSLHSFWVPRKLACRQFRYVTSLTLRKSSWFIEWSHLTGVLLLVWA